MFKSKTDNKENIKAQNYCPIDKSSKCDITGPGASVTNAKSLLAKSF